MNNLTQSDTLRAPAREALAQAAAESMPAEQRLLLAMANPKNMGMNVRKLCRKAGVSRDSYYRLMHDRGFQARRQAAIGESLGDVSKQLDALKESAAMVEGKHSGHDRRLLFELMGAIANKKPQIQPEQQQVDSPPILSPANLLWSYINLNFPRERWPGSIRDQYEQGVLKPEMPPLPGLSKVNDEPYTPDDEPSINEANETAA